MAAAVRAVFDGGLIERRVARGAGHDSNDHAPEAHGSGIDGHMQIVLANMRPETEG